jgi:hypothetical protein
MEEDHFIDPDFEDQYSPIEYKIKKQKLDLRPSRLPLYSGIFVSL